MKSIVVVCPQIEAWDAFIAELNNHCQIDVAEALSGEEAIALAKERKPFAMVIDQELGGIKGVDLVPQLLQINAFIYIALISDQTEAAFHEATEGLGILMKLSPRPDAQAAIDFYERLAGVI